MKVTSVGPRARALMRTMLSVACLFSSPGCVQISYCPLRWPSRAFSAPPTPEPFTITLPTPLLSDQAGRVEQDGMTVSAELLSPHRTDVLFHADLVRHDVQPLVLELHNASDQTYLFQRSQVGRGAIPAARAAEWADVHPVRRAGQYAKWMLWWFPGLVFETVIEPASTLDFTGVEEAARRPAPSQRARILQEFARHELADTALAPNGSCSGVVFIRPPALGQTIPLTLIDARTQQPRILQLPTPAPVYTTHQLYTRSPAVVSEEAIRAIATIKSWTLLSKDAGTIRVRKSRGLLGWPRATDITVMVHAVNDRQTDVVVEGARWRPRRAEGLDHSRTIDQFFETLTAALPEEALPEEESASPSAS